MRIDDSECRVAEGREKSELEAVEELSVMMLAIWRFHGGKSEDYADVCDNKTIHRQRRADTYLCRSLSSIHCIYLHHSIQKHRN
jgi:hypothetical protein